jgi:hypothetical protein
MILPAADKNSVDKLRTGEQTQILLGEAFLMEPGLRDATTWGLALMACARYVLRMS